ncbi:MAG: DUF4388 domain-containing protein [Acidobacteria bacterium]|nr:DUF4388 domain-containing protein [Acidobacteriota bacterium]
MAEEGFVYRGRLEETTLAEMLATIHRYHVPGVMTLERDGVVKHLYLIDGDIIFADSSDPSERLGTLLLEEGRLTKGQLNVASDELTRSKTKRLGEILVELGFLAPDKLGPAVRQQVEKILWSLFNWERGEVTFRVGRFREQEVYKITVPTARAILDGCRKIGDGRGLTARLGGRNAVLVRREVPPHLAGLRLQAGERDLLEMVDGKKTLFELCEEGPFSAGINARVLFALVALQVLEVEARTPSGVRIQVRSKTPESP